ncbi:MAG: hypothetical protein KAQ94_08825 [Arcobacteraceae bacterium]|nr:hypothetical protein [Arcobacteraceae bacterium]
MNKFNPLYLLLFSIMLFLYSMVDLKSSNESLLQIKEQNKQFVKISTKYNSLQKVWGKEQGTKKKFENILKLSNIRNANIVTNGKTIKIKIKNASLKSLDKFMNEILNETIVILNFSLTKNNLDLEVGL